MTVPPNIVGGILDANMALERRSSIADRVSNTTPLDSPIRLVPPSQYKAAAQCLSEAFASDKVVRYPIDTPDRAHWVKDKRLDLHRQALEYITYAHCVRGLVTTTGDNYACVALWMPPGKRMDGWLTTLQSGMWRLNYQLSSEGKKRFFGEFLPLLHKTKAEVMGKRDTDCWYLVYLGTKIASRGKGHARKLVEHITDRADSEGRACYLESSNDINPVIYGKMGFQVVTSIHLKRGREDVRMDIMLREPRQPGWG